MGRAWAKTRPARPASSRSSSDRRPATPPRPTTPAPRRWRLPTPGSTSCSSPGATGRRATSMRRSETGSSVLGIPAGVKIHSATFGVTPRAAGELAALFLAGKRQRAPGRRGDGYRRGGVPDGPRQRRAVRVPPGAGRRGPDAVDEGRAGSSPTLPRSNSSSTGSSTRWRPDDLYVIGPGTTTHAITAHLGLAGTLLGVDVVRNRELVAADVTETQLLEILASQPPGRPGSS